MGIEAHNESKFPAWLVGSWISLSSNIPDYAPGDEKLTWTVGGEETWKMAQCASIDNVAGRFRCEFRDGILRRWHLKTGNEYIPLRISRLDENTIEVEHPAEIPIHQTVFQRISAS